MGLVTRMNKDIASGMCLRIFRRVVIRIVPGDIRNTGIRPDNGGSVQNWHWPWHAHDSVP
jgi:hypothetical protein